MKSPLICRKKPHFYLPKQQIQLEVISKNPLHFYLQAQCNFESNLDNDCGLTSLCEEYCRIINDCHCVSWDCYYDTLYKMQLQTYFILIKSRGSLSQTQMLCWQHTGEPISLSKTLLSLQFLLFPSYFIDYTIQPWHFVLVYSALIISYNISFFCSFSSQLREPSTLLGF